MTFLLCARHLIIHPAPITPVPITDMGATTLTPEETRQKLKLKKHK